MVEGAKENDSFTFSLMEAEELGLDVVPNANLGYSEMDIEEVIEYCFDKAKEYNLPQDGVVFKFDDVEYGKSLGNTSHHFRNGIAYKVFNDSVETILRDIEWSCGKTGILTPVAIFDTVDIDGIYLEVSNREIKRRMLNRDVDRAESKRRYKADKKDFRHISKKVDYIVHNENRTAFETALICKELDEIKEKNNREKSEEGQDLL